MLRIMSNSKHIILHFRVFIMLQFIALKNRPFLECTYFRTRPVAFFFKLCILI